MGSVISVLLFAIGFAIPGQRPGGLCSGAFPQLTTHHHRAQTTLTGDLVDQEELQGVLSLLNSLGISVIEIVTIPD